MMFEIVLIVTKLLILRGKFALLLEQQQQLQQQQQ